MKDIREHVQKFIYYVDKYSKYSEVGVLSGEEFVNAYCSTMVVFNRAILLYALLKDKDNFEVLKRCFDYASVFKVFSDFKSISDKDIEKRKQFIKENDLEKLENSILFDQKLEYFIKYFKIVLSSSELCFYKENRGVISKIKGENYEFARNKRKEKGEKNDKQH